MGCINVKIERIGNGIQVNASRLGKGLQITCGLICSVGSSVQILWSDKYLSWLNSETGVVKYNYLTAMADWSLAEVEIEELL